MPDMVEPSPCPRCGSGRAWLAGPSHGPTVPVACGGCGRQADACPRCGWEWTGLPRSERPVRRGRCISCQVIELSGRRQRQGQPPDTFAAAFDPVRARSRLLQRLADTAEQSDESRYRCYRRFSAITAHAVRRADVVARLEAGLRHPEAPPEQHAA
jgi:ferredoxin